jgi:GH24 family phage-related lysozyme (muramidase)
VDKDRFAARLRQVEDVRTQAYDDKTGNSISPGSVVSGHPTVGVGFNLDRPDAREQIEAMGLDYDQVRNGTQHLDANQVDTLLDKTIDEAIAGARDNVSNFDTLPEQKQTALVDMVFNMGPERFGGFQDLIDAVEAEDWAKAASAMEDSQWSAAGGDRADDDVQAMRGDDEDGTQFGAGPRPDADPTGADDLSGAEAGGAEAGGAEAGGADAGGAEAGGAEAGGAEAGGAEAGGADAGGADAGGADAGGADAGGGEAGGGEAGGGEPGGGEPGGGEPGGRDGGDAGGRDGGDAGGAEAGGRDGGGRDGGDA